MQKWVHFLIDTKVLKIDLVITPKPSSPTYFLANNYVRFPFVVFVTHSRQADGRFDPDVVALAL